MSLWPLDSDERKKKRGEYIQNPAKCHFQLSTREAVNSASQGRECDLARGHSFYRHSNRDTRRQLLNSFPRPERECESQGEPQNFCKEMWQDGHGRIAVVPGVNREYSDEAGKKTKSKGHVSRLAEYEPVNGASTDIKREKKPTFHCKTNSESPAPKIRFLG